MESGTNLLPSILTPSSTPPCTSNSSEDCLESDVEILLEQIVFLGLTLWQLAGVILSILLGITIGLCCCIRFRIPRTKQEIEADYIRKKITRHFRKELTKISNNEMDEMDLRRALDKVRAEFDVKPDDEVPENQKKEETYEHRENSQPGFRVRFHTIFRGMGTHFRKSNKIECHNMI